jgi:hypothetical protein
MIGHDLLLLSLDSATILAKQYTPVDGSVRPKHVLRGGGLIISFTEDRKNIFT